jgi:hypothetical protein
MSKQDGGPAYPGEEVKTRLSGIPYEWQYHEGMTFRDRAAIAAMQGMLSYWGDFSFDEETEILKAEEYPKLAYDIADAMVAEKERRDNGDSG